MIQRWWPPQSTNYQIDHPQNLSSVIKRQAISFWFRSVLCPCDCVTSCLFDWHIVCCVLYVNCHLRVIVASKRRWRTTIKPTTRNTRFADVVRHKNRSSSHCVVCCLACFSIQCCHQTCGMFPVLPTNPACFHSASYAIRFPFWNRNRNRNLSLWTGPTFSYIFYNFMKIYECDELIVWNLFDTACLCTFTTPPQCFILWFAHLTSIHTAASMYAIVRRTCVRHLFSCISRRRFFVLWL